MVQAAENLRLAPFTVDQVHAMLDNGILEEGAPLELLDGMLVYKDRSACGEDPMTVGKKHRLAVQLVAELGVELEPFGCHVQAQNPITLPPHDEPEPDGAVVRGSIRDYRERHPGPADVECVIEVADASLKRDRGGKLAIYARAGIPQYLIVNLRDDCIEIHEQPKGSAYAATSVKRRGEAVSLRTGADLCFTVEVERLLP